MEITYIKTQIGTIEIKGDVAGLSSVCFIDETKKTVVKFLNAFKKLFVNLKNILMVREQILI